MTPYEKQLERMRRWRQKNPGYMSQAGKDYRARKAAEKSPEAGPAKTVCS